MNVLLLMDEHRRAAGVRLSQLREQIQWSQERLAQEAGVSVKTVNRFEKGKHEGRPNTIKALAKALDVDPEAITGPPPPPLGLGEESQLDRIEERLDEVVKLVAQVAEATAELLASSAPQGKPSRPKPAQRKSSAS